MPRYIANMNVAVSVDAPNILIAKEEMKRLNCTIEDVSFLMQPMPEEIIYSMEQEDQDENDT